VQYKNAASGDFCRKISDLPKQENMKDVTPNVNYGEDRKNRTIKCAKKFTVSVWCRAVQMIAILSTIGSENKPNVFETTTTTITNDDGY
jgi:hypothetical protein